MNNEEIRFLTTKEGQQLIRQHAHVDIATMRLNPSRYFKQHANLLIDQIAGRKKARKKLPSWYEKDDIIYPSPVSVEQASSLLSASYKQSLVNGERLIDLTGGMGIDCLHLAKEFREVFYVERNPALCQIFDWNKKVWKQAGIQVFNREASEFLSALPEGKLITWFFIDPARRDSINQKVVSLAECEPNVLDLLPQIIQKRGKVLLKTSPMLDVKQALEQLAGVSSVHIVAIKNEVKEVLYRINDTTVSQDPPIYCVDLNDGIEFSFHFSKESALPYNLGPVEEFLYEPNAAIQKGGAFKSVGAAFELKKLDKNSHLFTSATFKKDFPGKVFRVLSPVNKQSLKELLPDKKANIICRNHPLKPDLVKKKYQLKDGGNRYVIGSRNMGKPLLHICESLENENNQ